MDVFSHYTIYAMTIVSNNTLVELPADLFQNNNSHCENM